MSKPYHNRPIPVNPPAPASGFHPPAGFNALRARVPKADFTPRRQSGKGDWHTRMGAAVYDVLAVCQSRQRVSMRSALEYPKRALLRAVSLVRAIGIREWERRFTTFCGLPAPPAGFTHQWVSMRSALEYPKRALHRAVSPVRAIGIRGWKQQFTTFCGLPASRQRAYIRSFSPAHGIVGARSGRGAGP
jgi:hypothetical protein